MEQPGPIWGGWWFWEPPLAKEKEDEKDKLLRVIEAYKEKKNESDS